MCVAYAAYNMRLLISKMRCAMRPRSRYMFEVIYIIAGVGRLVNFPSLHSIKRNGEAGTRIRIL
jgi:hypothetical protein